MKGLVKTYKAEKSKYIAKPELEIDHMVSKQYETGDNLLSFLPVQVFYGQRPSVWWTLRHDIDLIIGTHRYGYANY